jgi:glucose-6-phosphate 1-epimerase
MSSPALVPRVVRHGASGATLHIYEFGAQVCSYTWRGQDALFMSSRAVLDGSKPIRGGIPLAFPQFAMQGPLPMHGFARTAQWAVEGEGDGFIELSLAHSEATLALWPHVFSLRYTVTFDGPTLRTALRITNPGPAPFAFEALQHTYLAGGGAGAITEAGDGALTIAGLRGMAFFAKPTATEGVEDREAFALAGEVDRIYRAPPGEGDIVVGGVAGPAYRSVTVRRKGSLADAAPGLSHAVAHAPLDVVVWNPGPVRAAAIADLGPEDWRAYVCIEPGRVSQATAEAGNLAPGKAFTLTQELLLQ